MGVEPIRPRERIVRRAVVRPERVVIEPPRRARLAIRAPLLLAIGFLGTILIGSMLLALPVANRTENFTPYLVALFTATSAVCVTGLVVVDTGTFWTPFGQAVILLLIQVGGLGFMTASTFLLIMLGRRISLSERMLTGSSQGVMTIGGIIGLTRQIVLVTAVIEAIGAGILFLRFAQELPVGSALWSAVFQSVSAFNNAGFDVQGEYRSLVAFNQDVPVMLTHVVLLVLGGIGFTVLLNVSRQRAFRYLLLDTKLVLLVSAILLGVGTVGILAMEYGNPLTLSPLGFPFQVLNAFFTSATARTAGFNTIATGSLTEGSLLLIIGLMYIGAGAGSTAGGIKVNTFAVLTAAVFSAALGRRSVSAFGRELPLTEVTRALSVALLALGLIFVVTVVLTVTDGFSLAALAFEVTSAFGTVGLSTGITPDLSLAGKLLITLTMFIGRVGPLTLALALAQRGKRPESYRYPEAYVRIG